MYIPGSICKYIPENPETDEQKLMSGYDVGILQILRREPEYLYDVLVLEGPWQGSRLTAYEAELVVFE